MKISFLGLTLISTRELDRIVAAARESAEATRQPTPPAQALPPVRPVLGPGPGETDERPAGGPPSAVRELVSVADRLADLTGSAAPADPQQTAVVLRWLESRAQSVLTAHGVVRIDDSGPVDVRRHEVVARRAAPSAELTDQIAQTIRPGYAWRGAPLRPQQVIAYVRADEADEAWINSEPASGQGPHRDEEP